MIYTIIISALTVLVVILGYTTFNLLRKNEKQEDVLVGYMEYLDRLSRVIEASDQKLKEVDAKEFFITSNVIQNISKGKDISVIVKKAKGTKCSRCWKIVEQIKENKCTRCSKIK